MTNREQAEAWIAEHGNDYYPPVNARDILRFADHLDASAGERAGNVFPANALVIFRDGNRFCAVRGDFKNLQENSAGFGEYRDEAIDELLYQEARVAASTALPQAADAKGGGT